MSNTKDSKLGGSNFRFEYFLKWHDPTAGYIKFVPFHYNYTISSFYEDGLKKKHWNAITHKQGTFLHHDVLGTSCSCDRSDDFSKSIKSFERCSVLLGTSNRYILQVWSNLTVVQHFVWLTFLQAGLWKIFKSQCVFSKTAWWWMR